MLSPLRLLYTLLRRLANKARKNGGRPGTKKRPAGAGGAAGRKCGAGRKAQPYGMIVNPCRGRFHIGPGTLRRRGHPRADMESAPTNLPKRPVKPDGRGHPGGRRAGCPHPAGPCGGARFRFWNRQGAAGVNARPTERGKHGGQPAKRGGVRFRGRAMALPYKPGGDTRPPGKPRPCAITNLCRGRCSHRPGNLAAARTPAGGINPAPTNKFCVLGQPGRPRLSGET